jgi:diguanylate cyclase (GGDEF)-like protein
VTESASGRGPVLDVRQRWRAGYVALGTAASMAVAAFWRPLGHDTDPRLRLAVILVLGLGLAGSALLASLRGRGRAETLALYAFLLLAIDGLGQILAGDGRGLPVARDGVPAWPLAMLVVGALAVAETPAVAYAAAAFASVLVLAETARGDYVAWRPALAVTIGYAGIVVAMHVALRGERQKLRRAADEIARLRFGLEPVPDESRLGTFRGAVRQLSEDGRRALEQDRTAELQLVLQRLVRLARTATRAHAALYFDVDHEREVARLRAFDGPPEIDAQAAVPVRQDPFASVLDRRVPFYVTDYPKLLDALPYYAKPVRVGTLLAVPVFPADAERAGDGVKSPIVTGVLVADRAEVQSFTGDEPQLLDTLAEAAAHSILQVRRSLGSEESAAEFKAVYAVSDSLARTFNPVEVRSLLLGAAEELVPFDGAAFLMLDTQRTCYEIEEAHGWAKEFEGRKVALLPEKGVSDTWAAYALRSFDGQHMLDDVGSMPILVLDEGRARAASLLFQPLRAANRTIGALLLTGPKGAFDVRSGRILGLLANQVAATRHHIQLFEREKLQAVRDGLTRLYNRRAFAERLAQARAGEERRGGVFSLLLLDLDHFKKLNDTYGHPAGDAALRNTARILERHCRAGDVPARYGGEEFALILQGADEQGALRLAERVRSTLEKDEIVFEGARIKVTASIGVAQWPRDGQETEALVAAADRALYAAKQGGRNRVVSAGRL